jgi:hypothetical protein
MCYVRSAFQLNIACIVANSVYAQDAKPKSNNGGRGDESHVDKACKVLSHDFHKFLKTVYERNGETPTFWAAGPALADDKQLDVNAITGCKGSTCNLITSLIKLGQFDFHHLWGALVYKKMT